MSAVLMSMPRKMLAAALVSGCMAAFADQPAHAAQWYIAGSGCAVDQANVAANNYQQFGVGVEFKPFSLGTIKVYCPVTVGAGRDASPASGTGLLQGSGYTLDLYHSDSNSSGGNVVADFFKMNLRTGVVTAVEGCERIDSSIGGGSAIGYNIMNKHCTHSFDPNGYLYFIRVSLTRNTSSAAVRFYGLSIYR